MLLIPINLLCIAVTGIGDFLVISYRNSIDNHHVAAQYPEICYLQVSYPECVKKATVWITSRIKPGTS